MPTTHEQPDFAHGKFLVFCNLQPTKSACSAATGNGLSGVGQPLSSVSGRKRYNTLDFPKENRVPTGMLRAPIGNPAPKGIFPLKFLIFLAGAYTNCKMQLDMPGQKMQKEACTGMRHRLPFGTGTQKKQMCFFYIPATPCGGGREKEIGAGGTAMKKS
ncbi:MAG: hypothetical protein SOT00_02230 [Eubacteriales bacterium]|nr:hypothetical protein [Eubacteriales bacterium]